MKSLLLILILILLLPPAPAGVRFDGVNDLLHSNTHIPFAFTNTISISLWIIKEAGMAFQCEFLGKGRVISGVVSHFQLRDNSGKFEFYYASPNSTFHQFTTTAAFTQTNVPIHIGLTMIWGDSNATYFYVNGNRVASSWFFQPSNNLGLTNNEPFRIGTTFTGSTFKGSIFEVAIWNRILTDPDMKSLASRKRGVPLQIQPANLRFYAPLEDNFAAWATMSGSNALTDVTQYHTPLTPLNSPIQHPMRWLSPIP